MRGRIIQGDALSELKKLPDASVDCSMSSPPYWALRDYGVEGQLGLEPTFEQFISNLCDIYDEVKRVLKPTGTCWVNLGDTYSGSWGNYAPGGIKGEQRPQTEEGKRWDRRAYSDTSFKPPSSSCQVQEKSLCLIPHRFAIEMINRGWILRNTIIWHKSNCMPQSAKDRFTVDFEYIFFFSKAKRYYFDVQREPLAVTDGKTRAFGGNKAEGYGRRQYSGKPYTAPKLSEGARNQSAHSFQRKGHSGYFDGEGNPLFNPQGRNKRCVWKINPKPFPEAHFAVYPEELCETPIKAGCPEFVCKECGKPRERKYDVSYKPIGLNPKSQIKTPRDYENNLTQGSKRPQQMQYGRAEKIDTFRGFSTPCSCNAGYEVGTVLDPFLGSGTTALVAEKLGRRWLGIELNPEYVKIAEKRLEPYRNQSRLTEVCEA